MSFWQILGIIAVSVLLLTGALSTPNYIRARRAWRDRRGGWEIHPCVMPSNLNFTVEGKIWRCHCGRRWKYLGSKVETQPRFGTPGRLLGELEAPTRTSLWQEWTTELELAEAEKLLRKQLGEK